MASRVRATVLAVVALALAVAKRRHHPASVAWHAPPGAATKRHGAFKMHTCVCRVAGVLLNTC